MKRRQPEDHAWAADTVGIVKFRLTVLQRLMSASSTPIGFFLGGASLWIAGEPASLVMMLPLLWGGLIGGLLGAFAGPTFAITLSPHMAQVRNLRRRKIYWSDVQMIRIEKKRFGNRRIVIYEANGRQTRLRAPVTGFLLWDRHFEEKFHVIGQWWLDFRGPDWQPGYEPWSAKPIRAAARHNAGHIG
jgi:hypothetical protein